MGIMLIYLFTSLDRCDYDRNGMKILENRYIAT